jgi:beta-lactamase class A
MTALVACGGGEAERPVPTATAEASATPLAAAGSPSATPALLEPTAGPEVELDGTCPDPYPEGATYRPAAARPGRLAPLGAPPPLARYQPMPLVRDAQLERLVRDRLGDEIEHFAVVVKDLADGSGVSLSATRGFYAASLFKTWVMLEAFHQREAGLLDLGEQYIVSDYYDQYRLNPVELLACATVTAEEALLAMLSVSDNVAANLLYDRVGVANTNQALRQLGLGATGFTEGGNLLTTAGGMAHLLEAIALGEAVSEGASAEMVALLEREVINDRLPAQLPAGTRVAHKTGNWENATHDAGIVYSPGATYLIVVLTDYGFTFDGALLIARLSRAVYDYYNPG